MERFKRVWAGREFHYEPHELQSANTRVRRMIAKQSPTRSGRLNDRTCCRMK